MKKHTWKLVGPWYRWQRPGVPSVGRASRPVFQKYDGPSFIAEFLKDPQHSLKFLQEDFVHEVRNLSPLNPAMYLGKPRRLSDLGYFPTSTRKLFLDTHKRFYLVVCELHCDIAGFPSVNRNEVCDTGFVIRKRVVRNLSAVALSEVEAIIKRLGAARQVVSELAILEPDMRFNIMKRALAPQGTAMLNEALCASLDKNQQLALAQLSAERQRLVQWARGFGVTLQLQGWRKIRDGIGDWFDVAEDPADNITEEVFKLFPLVADPRLQNHSAKDRTIFFGVVPTGSADTDEFGKARFDDVSQYEIRCFVRRHKHEERRTPKCCGEIVWSLPTEVYRLASHFDLVGTNNRPISMQLPDLKALEAQAAALPPNQLAPFRMVSPPDSNLEVNADEEGNITDHGTSGQICSFSIPLITIVATFVFKLFLPVVTLLFGLFFLLKLKFCIPPSIQLSADIAKELNDDLQLGLDVSVDAKFAVGTNLGNKIDEGLRAGFGDEMTDGLRNGVPDRPGGFGPRAVAEMTDGVYQSGQPKNAPSLVAKLEYEPHVEPEVVA